MNKNKANGNTTLQETRARGSSSKKRSTEAACTRCSRLLLLPLPGVPAAVYSFAAVLVRGRGARGKRSKRRVNALLSMLHERCTSKKDKEGTADDERLSLLKLWR